jgi:hypothetical protein
VSYSKQTYLISLLLSCKAYKNEALLFKTDLTWAISHIGQNHLGFLFDIMTNITNIANVLYLLLRHGIYGRVCEWARNWYTLDISDMTSNLILNRICNNLRKKEKVLKSPENSALFLCRAVFQKVVTLSCPAPYGMILRLPSENHALGGSTLSAFVICHFDHTKW